MKGYTRNFKLVMQQSQFNSDPFLGQWVLTYPSWICQTAEEEQPEEKLTVTLAFVIFCPQSPKTSSSLRWL